jgi:adenine phosphoribosyltransferase
LVRPRLHPDSHIEKLGGKVVEMAFIVDLPEVGGKKKLKEKGYKVFVLTEFEGE